VQGGTAHEPPAKTTVGSDGRRSVRRQGGETNLHKQPLSGGVVNTALKDRLVGKAPEVHGKKAGVAIKNLENKMVTLQQAIELGAEPGYRASKSQALVKSIRTLRGISGQLGNTGSDVQLKKELNDLLGTRISGGREGMTLSDFGSTHKLAKFTADAPTRTQVEKKTVELLARAHSLLNGSAYNYSPREYTAPFILENAEQGAFIGDNGRFADDTDVSTIKGWNSDYKRTSHAGPIVFGRDGRPLNPMGVTGVTGRGALGLWGPNHAADTIVTRPGDNGTTEVLLIQRKDTGQWALPGGMVENKTSVLNAALKELAEEALVIGDCSDGKNLNHEAIDNKVQELKQYQCFQRAENTYKGVVDDPRNTDNAWMETEAWSVDLGPEEAAALHLQAGDDAKAARWVPVTPENISDLYASHSQIILTSPSIQKALDNAQSGSVADPTVADGVVPALDLVDDSDVVPSDARANAIPTPPPPPPLPGEQAADSSTARLPRTDVSKGYDAVIEELKQTLLERRGPVEADDPSVVVTSGQNPVNRPAPGKLSDLDRARKAEASKGYDAVIAELKQKLLEKGGLAEVKDPSVVVTPGKNPVSRPAPGKLPDLGRAHKAEASKGYDAVIAELKEKLLKRSGVAESEYSEPAETNGVLPQDNPQAAVTKMSVAPDNNVEQKSDESSVAESSKDVTEQRVSQQETRKNNYDAVIAELKNLQKQQKNSGAYNSGKGDDRQE